MSTTCPDCGHDHVDTVEAIQARTKARGRALLETHRRSQMQTTYRETLEALNARNEVHTLLLPLRSPCCNQHLRSTRCGVAEQVKRRTCPKCKALWQVTVEPLKGGGGGRMDALHWVCVRGAP